MSSRVFQTNASRKVAPEHTLRRRPRRSDPPATSDMAAEYDKELRVMAGIASNEKPGAGLGTAGAGFRS